MPDWLALLIPGFSLGVVFTCAVIMIYRRWF